MYLQITPFKYKIYHYIGDLAEGGGGLRGCDHTFLEVSNNKGRFVGSSGSIDSLIGLFYSYRYFVGHKGFVDSNIIPLLYHRAILAKSKQSETCLKRTP